MSMVDIRIQNLAYGMRRKKENPDLQICFKCGFENMMTWDTAFLCSNCGGLMKPTRIKSLPKGEASKLGVKPLRRKLYCNDGTSWIPY